MKILQLQLENFRNYTEHKHIFSDQQNPLVISGPNGMGKTNFLEALYLLSLGKSFRSVTQDDLIAWGNDYFRCIGEISVNGEKQKLEVSYSKFPARRKNFKINDVSRTNSDYIGTLLTVLFHPEDMNILYLSPSLRRKYMDILLSQVEKKYLKALSKYQRILKQRNALLDQIRKAKFGGADTSTLLKDLDVWDEEMSHPGATIIKSRFELTAFFNEHLSEKYQYISGQKEKISVQYLTEATDTPETYLRKLRDRRDTDIIKAVTTLGPHRDDLLFHIDQKEITASASRGEFRTLLLAMKLLEIDFIHAKTNKKPILLLDDVFSELDPNRQKKLLKTVSNYQSIITTADPH